MLDASTTMEQTTPGGRRRLDLAAEAIARLASMLEPPRERLGLISFNRGAELRAPLDEDPAALLRSLAQLRDASGDPASLNQLDVLDWLGDPATGDLRAIGTERNCAPLADPAAVIGKIDHQRMRSGRKRLRRGKGRSCPTQEVVNERRYTFAEVQRVTTL